MIDSAGWATARAKNNGAREGVRLGRAAKVDRSTVGWSGSTAAQRDGMVSMNIASVDAKAESADARIGAPFAMQPPSPPPRAFEQVDDADSGLASVGDECCLASPAYGYETHSLEAAYLHRSAEE